MQKYYWIFGGIAGLFSFGMEYLLFSGSLGYEKSAAVLLAKLATLLICIVFAAILIRKVKGSVSTARTMLSGFLIALICSAVSISGYTVMSNTGDDFFAAAKNYSFDRWAEAHVADAGDAEKRQIKLDEIERTYSIQHYAAFTLVGYLVSGLFVSIFAAAFISTKSSLSQA